MGVSYFVSVAGDTDFIYIRNFVSAVFTMIHMMAGRQVSYGSKLAYMWLRTADELWWGDDLSQVQDMFRMI